MSRRAEDTERESTSYRFECVADEPVADTCTRLRDIPDEINNIEIDDFAALFAGRTTIEAVQIQLALYHSNVARQVNGEHQPLHFPSHRSAELGDTGLHIAGYTAATLLAMDAKQNSARCTNGLMTEAIDYFILDDSNEAADIDRSRGVCFGLTTLAINAFLSGNMSTYIERTQAFACMNPKSFPDFMTALKRMIDSYQLLVKHLPQEDALFAVYQRRLDELRLFHTDLQAFMYSVEFYQQPERHRDAIAEDADIDVSQTGYIAKPLLQPVEIPEAVLPEQLAHIQDAYKPEILSDELGIMIDHLVVGASHGDGFSMSLYRFGHEMALHYDAVNQQWFLQNPNHLPGQLFKNTSEGRLALARCIFAQNTLTDGQSLCLSMRLFVQKTQLVSFKGRLSDAVTALAEYRTATPGAIAVRNEKDKYDLNLLGFGGKYLLPEATVLKALTADPGLHGHVFPSTNTLLMRCIRKGYDAAIKQLLQIGADVAVENMDGWTALDYAVSSGKDDLVKQLLVLGNINKLMPVVSGGGITPLMYACSKGYDDVVLQLIGMGADVSIVSGKGGRVMDFDGSKLFPATVEALLLSPQALNVPIKRNGMTPLLYAIENNLVEVAKQLLVAGASLNAVTNKGVSALMLACQRGHLELVQSLLARGAEVDCADSDDLRVLNYLAGYKHAANYNEATFLAITREILLAPQALGHRVLNEGDTPIEYARRCNLPDVAAELELRHRNRNRLLLACEKGDVTKLNVFIREGDDIHRTNSRGMTALDIAVERGDVAIINTLLSAGADANSVLSRACELGNLDVVVALIKGKANIEVQRPSDGYRPIHIACQTKDEKLFELLLKAGADGMAKTASNATAMSIVARCNRGRAKHFQFLLKSTRATGIETKPVPPAGGSPVAAQELCVCSLVGGKSPALFGGRKTYRVVKARGGRKFREPVGATPVKRM